ncbi:MAG: response regulator [Alphaproteobacteria bacterium]|mgnify:CR=1 FL=1|jgi:CheY-like chemotaxis protein|nr:response regulator [Alphaproteobacteria bacterium]MDP6515170.1 response regulator [Alphaproteobacteria bacterium]|tara:strand:+ start:220 stop:627 length:408 start_codon:yes stop_codon:yes gene_type:complete
MSNTKLDKVLYVEDEADIRAVARIALETVGGFTVKICESGSEAVAAVPDFEPQLVLLDVMMPGMDGPGTMAALHALPGFDSLPVVFLTAKAMPTEIERYKKLGAIGVIRKPFDPMALSKDVQKIWRGRAGAAAKS